MNTGPANYESGGQRFTGFLADGSRGGRAAGLLVIHEGLGLTQHVKDVARRLAELGYVAYAMNLFGDVALSLDEAKALVRALRADRAELRRRARLALEVLAAHEHVDRRRLAAIGYCFGGTAALELARSGAELAGVIGLHAGLDAAEPRDASAVRAKILICTGDADPIVTRKQREDFVAEMESARIDWQMHVYGGVGHSFTNPEIDAWGFPGFAYHAIADQRSWRAMLAFLEESLGPPEFVMREN